MSPDAQASRTIDELGPVIPRPLTEVEEADLRDLTWHWDNYSVRVADGKWHASPLRDPAAILTADSAHDLRRLIRDEHLRRTVNQPGSAASGCLPDPRTEFEGRVPSADTDPLETRLSTAVTARAWAVGH
jgi:hypothetical protein